MFLLPKLYVQQRRFFKTLTLNWKYSFMGTAIEERSLSKNLTTVSIQALSAFSSDNPPFNGRLVRPFILPDRGHDVHDSIGRLVSCGIFRLWSSQHVTGTGSHFTTKDGQKSYRTP